MKAPSVRLSAALVLALLSLATPFAFAQSPLSFDLSLAPNTSGTLEGSASLRLRWAAFGESGLTFSASSFLEEYPEGGGTTTVIQSRKTLDLEVFRLPSDVLALRFGRTGGVSLSPVALVNGVVLDEDKYGEGTGYIFYIAQRTMWAKPLLGADLNLGLGSVSAEMYYRTSWPFTLNEYLEGSANYSTNGITTYSVWDEGFETRLGGTVSFRPAPGWTVRGGVDWVRHIGHSVANSSLIIPPAPPPEFVYESQILEGSVTLTFPLGERRPMVGLAYARDAFRPLELFSVEPYTNSRFRFLLGLEL
mgnify:FL=1